MSKMYELQVDHMRPVSYSIHVSQLVYIISERCVGSTSHSTPGIWNTHIWHLDRHLKEWAVIFDALARPEVQLTVMLSSFHIWIPRMYEGRQILIERIKVRQGDDRCSPAWRTWKVHRPSDWVCWSCVRNDLSVFLLAPYRVIKIWIQSLMFGVGGKHIVVTYHYCYHYIVVTYHLTLDCMEV